MDLPTLSQSRMLGGGAYRGTVKEDLRLEMDREVVKNDLGM